MTTPDASPTERPLDIDLLRDGRLPPLPTAFFQDRDRDLLDPLRFLPPGKIPDREPPQVDRSALANALADANTSYGHPRARQLADKLADPATRVVVTGQQPGLYGGPLLTLTKMAAAVRWAEEIEAAGQPAVAVFWVATEDHDWRELSQASFLTREGARTVDLGEDREPLKPIGLRALEGIDTVEEQLADALGRDLFAERLRDVGQAYRPDAHFGEAFCSLVVEIFGERAPLLLDSMLPAVRRLQSPWFERLIDHRQALDAGYLAADARLAQRGYSPQVRYQAGLSPLFLIRNGERRRIEWIGEDGYILRGVEGPPEKVADLRALAREQPDSFSPGVLARPALQDALLGTTLQIMGPSELSYLTQASTTYQILGIEAPWTTLRPQILLLEERQASYLDELGVPLARIFGESAEEIVAERLGEDFISPVRERLAAMVEELRAPALALDANLEKPFEKTRGQIERAFDQLNGRVTKAFATRHEVWNRRLEQIRESCLPDGHPQERHLAVAYFVARYGASFAEIYRSKMDLDPRRLQGIVI